MKAETFNKKYAEFLKKRKSGCLLTNQKAIDYLDKEFQELIQIPGFSFSEIRIRFKFFRIECDNVSLKKVLEMESKLLEIHDKETYDRMTSKKINNG